MSVSRKTTRVKQIDGGKQVKQSDTGTIISYQLQDGYGNPQTDLVGKDFSVTLTTKRGVTYFEQTGKVKDDAIVGFNLNKIIPPTSYIVTVRVEGVCYPSDNRTQLKIIRAYDVSQPVPKQPSPSASCDLKKGITSALNKYTVEQVESMLGILSSLSVKDGDVVVRHNERDYLLTLVEKGSQNAAALKGLSTDGTNLKWTQPEDPHTESSLTEN